MIKPICWTWINTNMVLLKYFRKSSFLPDPNGSYQNICRRKVQKLDNENLGSKRGQYAKCSVHERAKVVK